MTVHTAHTVLVRYRAPGEWHLAWPGWPGSGHVRRTLYHDGADHPGMALRAAHHFVHWLNTGTNGFVVHITHVMMGRVKTDDYAVLIETKVVDINEPNG